MIAAPALDLRRGRTVQLVGGRPEEERVSLPDPVSVARRWWEYGFQTLHVVDLDRALGLGSNLGLAREVVAAWPGTSQVGGGLRDDTSIDQVLSAGADRAIVGTRAVDDPDWLARTAEARPGRLMVAADVREGWVLRRGWREATPLSVPELLARIGDAPLGGVLCTDVSREGRLEGIDLREAGRIIEASPHSVWISGGIRSMDELRALEEEGAAGAVLGMALYTGALDPEAVAQAWGGSRGSGAASPTREPEGIEA